MPKWTNAQSDAINAKNSNILVSAAAGSGKTAVLVERVINTVLSEENDVNLDELLGVTFTNAAAAEMKTRISKALSTVINNHPDHTEALTQLSLVPNAKICTIDSFCMNLVKENFFNLDIEQDFKILESSESQLLEQNAIEAVIEELYEEDESEFKNLVELLSTTKSDEELINTVKKIHNYISSQPFPLEWLKVIGEYYNPEITSDECVLKDYIIDEIRFSLDYAKELIESAKELLIVGDEMYDAYSSMLISDFDVISGLEDSLTLPWDEMRDKFINVSFATTPSKRGFSADYKDTLLETRKAYAGSSGIVRKDIFKLLSMSSKDVKEDNEKLYPVIKSLIELVNKYDEKLLLSKKEIGAYTFSDIMHFAIKLLFRYEDGKIVTTQLAKELRLQFKEILVDEYQDTNTAQDTLFSMLSNGKNLFMVGDVKQSIYRFRLAMPSIFNEKRLSFTSYSSDSESLNKKIILDKNFRSRDGICELTNFVFSKLMSSDSGDTEYNKEDYLYCGAEYPESDIPSSGMFIVDTPEGEDKVEYEARQTASLILSKIKKREQIFDGNENRDIRFGDIAVLLRSAKTSMPKYVKVFSEFGIPTVANNRTNLFDNSEVSILLSLVRVVDNPVQDVPLLSTLMSVFYGYTADDIASARVQCKRGSLYSAVCTDKERFSAFLSDLEKYKRYASSMSTESFLRQVISETSFIALISAFGNEEQRKLNVLKLVELAKNFDRGENVGLTAFIRYVDSIEENKLEVDSAELNASDENAVQIMTVHKSKGLEFPVVILADSAHQYNKEDEKASVLLNHEHGIGLKVNHEEGLYRYNSFQYNAIRLINSKASFSENLRVLYVAITRAKEQFIAVASFKKASEHIVKKLSNIIDGKIPPYVIRKTNNDADLLLMCALLHKDNASYSNLDKYDSNFDFAFPLSIINENAIIEESEIEEAKPDNELVEKIREKLSFRYERNELSAFTSKRTASSLDETEHSFKYFAKSKPAFLSKNNLTPAQRGTAMHAFMQYCNYQNARNDLENEIERLLSDGFIDELQAASLNRDSLNNLFNSEFAERMFKSDRLYREIKVSSFVPVNELEDTEFTDKVLIQGIADCVFEENGKLVLVDYKTDFVKSEEELLDMYKKQIAFYKTAVEKTLCKEVKETMLYSFSLNKVCAYK